MTSREKMLAAVKKNQPAPVAAPPVVLDVARASDPGGHFTKVLTAIGGVAIDVEDIADITTHIAESFNTGDGIFNNVEDLPFQGTVVNSGERAGFEKLKLVVLRGHFAVAENAAVWVTDRLLADRVLPFITEHLMLIVNRPDIVPTMADAYEKIGADKYGFGTFIAGPSKTADIEQSLVLGAHGPKSLTVFLVGARK